MCEVEIEALPIGGEALERAIAIVGLTKLAADIGVDYQLIQGWKKPGRKFATPSEYCAGVERAVESVSPGAVTRRDLRPTDWMRIWPELATPSDPAEERVA